MGCLIFNMLLVHDKDKSITNGTSSTIGNREIETNKLPCESEISQSLEQGGTSGTNLLVEKSYFDHINLNN